MPGHVDDLELPPGVLPDADHPWMLTTGRQLFHYNVGTMTRRTDLVQLHKAKHETLRLLPSDARHFPESRTNILTGEAVDEFTGCPEYKVCAVRLTKVAAPA